MGHEIRRVTARHEHGLAAGCEVADGDEQGEAGGGRALACGSKVAKLYDERDVLQSTKSGFPASTQRAIAVSMTCSASLEALVRSPG